MTDWDTINVPPITNRGNTYDSWWFEWDLEVQQATIRLYIERIYEERGAIWSEWRAELERGEKRLTVLTPSRVNLLNTQRNGWKAHSDIFADVMPDFAWDLCLQQAVEYTLTEYRAGNPGTSYADSTTHKIVPHLLEPWIAGEGVTVLFGEGGMGKVFTMSAGVSPSFGDVDSSQQSPCGRELAARRCDRLVGRRRGWRQ